MFSDTAYPLSHRRGSTRPFIVYASIAYSTELGAITRIAFPTPSPTPINRPLRDRILPILSISNPFHPWRPSLRSTPNPRVKTHPCHLLGIKVRRLDEDRSIPPIYAAGARRHPNAVLQIDFPLVYVVDVEPYTVASVADGERPGAFQSFGRSDVVGDVGGAEKSGCVSFAGVVVDARGFEGTGG